MTTWGLHWDFLFTTRASWWSNWRKIGKTLGPHGDFSMTIGQHMDIFISMTKNVATVPNCTDHRWSWKEFQSFSNKIRFIFQNRILADLKGFGGRWIWKTVERHDEEDGRSSRPIQWLSLYLEELSSQIISALLIGRQSRAVALPAGTQPSDWSRERKSATEADVHLSQLCDSYVWLVRIAAKLKQ